jgi:hypothetical protein
MLSGLEKRVIACSDRLAAVMDEATAHNGDETKIASVSPCAFFREPMALSDHKGERRP